MVAYFYMVLKVSLNMKWLTVYQKKPGANKIAPGLKDFRRRPTLPHSLPCSTIGAEGLYFRVRDGNGCIPLAIATEKLNYFLLQFAIFFI